MVKKNILLLCHGGRHNLEGCPTTGIPLTIKVIEDMYTVDQNVEAEANLHTDWRKPTNIKGKFEIVTTRCCFYSALIKTTGDLENNSFKNIIKVLKKDGIFIFSMAPYGLFRFASFLLRKGYYQENESNIKGNKWWNNQIPPWKKTTNTHLTLFTKDKLSKLILKFKNDPNVNNRLTQLLVLYIEHKYPSLQLIRKPSDIETLYTHISKKYMTQSLAEELKQDFIYNQYCWYFVKK